MTSPMSIRYPLALLGAAVAVAFLAACADFDGPAPQDMRRVGLMHVGTDHIPPSLGSLTTQLADEFGWDVPAAQVSRCVEEKRKRCDFEGEDITLMWRNLEPAEADAQAEAFVGQGVDVIVAYEDASIRAAQSATTGNLSAASRTRTRISVVFLHPSDPVADGLVKSLPSPGTNLTGVFGARDEVDKQLEIYQRLVPGLRRMLTLVDPQDPRTKRLLPGYQAAAAQLARPIELEIREASSAQELTSIFRSLRPGEVDGAFLLSPSLRLNHTALTIRLAEQARLPVQAHRKEWVEQGALFSYGLDLPLIGRTGAYFVDRILRGTPPDKLPVRHVPKLEFAINLATASRLGIEVPENMIIRAEVYKRERRLE